MKPILLKGHERSITFVKYNREGDLLFTSSKDDKPTLWCADSGERIGTYNGHQGTVWSVDVSWDSSTLVSASADMSFRLWDVESGKCTQAVKQRAPVRSVAFDEGHKRLALSVDQFMGVKPAVFIFSIQPDGKHVDEEPLLEIVHPKKIKSVMWGPLNKYLVTGCEDGLIRIIDPQTGEITKEIADHKKGINNLCFSYDKTCFLSSSADHTVNMYDAHKLECVKTYETEKPCNSAFVDPLNKYVIVGGGQEAMNVTMTSTRVGKFEVNFFDMAQADLIGNVTGHFGPVNSLAYRPDGKGYASGGEDGYIRLHKFDDEYYKLLP